MDPNENNNDSFSRLDIVDQIQISPHPLEIQLPHTTRDFYDGRGERQDEENDGRRSSGSKSVTTGNENPPLGIQETFEKKLIEIFSFFIENSENGSMDISTEHRNKRIKVAVNVSNLPSLHTPKKEVALEDKRLESTSDANEENN